METLLWVVVGFVAVTICCTIAHEAVERIMLALFGIPKFIDELAECIHREFKPDAELDAAMRKRTLTQEQREQVAVLFAEAAAKGTEAYVEKFYPQ